MKLLTSCLIPLVLLLAYVVGLAWWLAFVGYQAAILFSK